MTTKELRTILKPFYSQVMITKILNNERKPNYEVMIKLKNKIHFEKWQNIKEHLNKKANR